MSLNIEVYGLVRTLWGMNRPFKINNSLMEAEDDWYVDTHSETLGPTPSKSSASLSSQLSIFTFNLRRVHPSPVLSKYQFYVVTLSETWFRNNKYQIEHMQIQFRETRYFLRTVQQGDGVED